MKLLLFTVFNFNSNIGAIMWYTSHKQIDMSVLEYFDFILGLQQKDAIKMFSAHNSIKTTVKPLPFHIAIAVAMFK